eukprot:10498214-Prorocentrum_lima.AAC.1
MERGGCTVTSGAWWWGDGCICGSCIPKSTMRGCSAWPEAATLKLLQHADTLYRIPARGVGTGGPVGW